MNLPTPELVRAPPAVFASQTRFITELENRLNANESVNFLGRNCCTTKLSPTSVTSLTGGPNSPGSVVLSGEFCTFPKEEIASSAEHEGHEIRFLSNDSRTADWQKHYQNSGRTKLPTKKKTLKVRSQISGLKPGLESETLQKQAILLENKFQSKIKCSVTRGSAYVKTTNDLRRTIRAGDMILIDGDRVQVSGNTSEWTSSRILLAQDWPHDSASDVTLAVSWSTRPSLSSDRIEINSQQKANAILCISEVEKQTEKGVTASKVVMNRVAVNGVASPYLSPLIHLSRLSHANSVQQGLGIAVNGRLHKKAETSRFLRGTGNDMDCRDLSGGVEHANTTLNAAVHSTPTATVKVKWSIKSAKVIAEDKNRFHLGSDSLFLKATDFRARTLERIQHRREAVKALELQEEEERKIFIDPKMVKGEDEERTMRMNELRRKTLARMQMASAKVEEDNIRMEKSSADRLRIYSLRTGRLSSLPSMYNGPHRNNTQPALTTERKSVSAEGALNPRYLMALKANGSALPSITPLTLSESPLTLVTGVPLSPRDTFLAHTMTKRFSNMPTVSSPFGTERPSVSSTLVPLALTASGTLTYHNAQHKADSSPSSGNLNFNFRDLKSLNQDNFLTMEEDSLDEASTTGLFPLNPVVQYDGHWTMQEEIPLLAASWPDIHSEVRETSEPMKSTTLNVEENNECEDSQSVLSELSSEERSLSSSNRDKSSQYIDFINNNNNIDNNNKNKNRNKKIAPWRVLKPIVLKSFIAITPQII